MWWKPAKIFELEQLSDVDWVIFAAVNVAFLLFFVAVAPQLRVILRRWRLEREDIGRAWRAYYRNWGGPSIFFRNLVPELAVIFYAYLGGLTYWILVSPVVPIICLSVSLLTFLFWRGRQIGLRVARLVQRRKQPRRTPEEAADSPLGEPL
ncbi:MAG: hypothetical protein JSU65_03880 [Candidatus Zixiibacteriota bacterium]|nr:MAG: hypothetical protein JSU65_03880 [candidate division Zixibacteria bacterium]